MPGGPTGPVDFRLRHLIGELGLLKKPATSSYNHEARTATR
jgi:hypothetical protein